MSTEIITIRAAPLAPISSLNQTCETWSQVTGEALHSTALGSPPLPSNSSLPGADNFAGFICDQRCSLVLLRALTRTHTHTQFKPRKSQKAESVKLRPLERCECGVEPRSLVAELALVGCRRRASLRTLMDLVSQSSQRGFSAVRGRFLPVRHHLTARPHNPGLLFPNKPLFWRPC